MHMFALSDINLLNCFVCKNLCKPKYQENIVCIFALKMLSVSMCCTYHLSVAKQCHKLNLVLEEDNLCTG